MRIRGSGSMHLGLRPVLDSSEKRITFLPEGDQMIVRHDIGLHGPKHEVEMTLLVRVRFDADGRPRRSPLNPRTSGCSTTSSTSPSRIPPLRRSEARGTFNRGVTAQQGGNRPFWSISRRMSSNITP